MSEPRFFSTEEYEQRLTALRQEMAERGLDGCLVTTPENIYYLAGLSHQGFFAYHVLLVPRSGQLTLITRAMERITIEVQVPHVRFVGHADSADPAQITAQALQELDLSQGRLGLEKANLFLPPRIVERLARALPQAEWIDVSGLVDQFRLVKSPRELAYVRQAAAVSDAMMEAALVTAAAGVSEKEVAAEVHRAMILAGGEYPGFGPFIRSTPRLGQEHGTWSDRVLEPGDLLFVELAGCVARYHAPMGRLLFVGQAPDSARAIERVCLAAFEAVVAAIEPGVKAKEVYQAWQTEVDKAGLSHYRRHHCGYLVGIGFPPSWVGGSMVVGLRHDSDLELQPGMVFHLLSWLMGSGQGDYFVSNAAALNSEGCQVLTTASNRLQVV